MRDQFESIPTELEEAAMVDGLSIWGAFFTIILPIALPGMVAAAILEWWTMAAISFASILPLLVVGVFLERYIIMGMSAGAVK